MKNKILVVDDNTELAEEFREILVSAGYEVLLVPDGMQAVYTARKIRPVLILLDLKLKYRSGLEVATELKRRVETSGIPMIAMSGFYPEERRNWLKRFCGISVFLKKPIDPTDLITEIERLLKEKNGKVDDIERRVL